MSGWIQSDTTDLYTGIVYWLLITKQGIGLPDKFIPESVGVQESFEVSLASVHIKFNCLRHLHDVSDYAVHDL